MSSSISPISDGLFETYVGFDSTLLAESGINVHYVLEYMQFSGITDEGACKYLPTFW
jgi:hypothetical protein